MPEQEEKIRNYLKKYLKKGYSKESLKSALIKYGYSPEIIDSVFKEFPKKKIEKPIFEKPITAKIKPAKKTYGIILTVLAVVIIVVIIFILPKTADCGYDKACFTEKANNCENAVLREKIEDTNTIIKYTTNNCNLIKIIEFFDKDEPEEVVSLFKGKEMSCSYEKNNFNEGLIDGLVGGIEDCSGSLKDAVYELRIAQYELGT